MEWETLVSVVALNLQVAGWASLALSKLSPSARTTVVGEVLLVGCLIGLGSVTLVGACFQFTSALSSGLTAGLLLSIGMLRPTRELGTEPDATSYSAALQF